MKNWQRYPEYKDSGVEWLGEIPKHWEVKKVKYLCNFLDYKRIPLSSEIRGGMTKQYPYYGASGIIDYVEDYIFDESLILVAEDGANLFSRSSPLAFVATGKYWVNNHAHILKPLFSPLDFWAYVLATIIYDPWITGSAQPKLTSDNLGSIGLPYPPLKERIAIAHFLDRETSKLDKLIAKKQRFIELLQEKRTALISHAVTKGLNPDIPMKDSGISWLGQIPKHWLSLPAFTIFQEQQISNKGMIERNLLSLSYGNIVRKDIDTHYGLLPQSFETYQIVFPGNLILRLTDLQNDKRSLRVGLVKEKGIITSAYLCLTPHKLISEYAYYLLHSYDITKVFYTMGAGVRQTMKFVDLKKLSILVPPLSEQKAIAHFLDQETAKIDTLIEKTKTSIEKLKEYRTALISAAVTGKIDIREEI